MNSAAAFMSMIQVYFCQNRAIKYIGDLTGDYEVLCMPCAAVAHAGRHNSQLESALQ